MTQPASCPRCLGAVRAPDLWSSAWRCDDHGEVAPFHTAAVPGDRALQHVVGHAVVPVWIPWPMPTGWLVTGVGHAGDERSGARASVVACSGPSPVGGLADLVLVAEEVGVGLGARYAGLTGTDPGPVADGAPDAKIEAAGHPTPLWCATAPDDRAVFFGEAKGLWLWAVLWPASAGLLVHDNVSLHDLREHLSPLEAGLPFGALSPRLAS